MIPRWSAALAAGLLVLVSLGRAAGAAEPGDKCYACHTEAGTPEAAAYKTDVHFANGVSCADCHGGDRTSEDQDAAMDKKKGFIGVPAKADIPKVCGKCHGPGDNPYKRQYHLDDVRSAFEGSAHGQALDQSDAGPQCVSCHGIHSIAPVKDPRSSVHPLKVAKTCAKCHSNAAYMRDFNPRLPVDQYEKYLTSQHGKLNSSGDPKPATCVSCHGNHAVLQVKDPRAPVYLTKVPGTCGHCHSDARYMAQYHIPTDQYEGYKQSAHGVALLKNSDLNAPACNSCHGNHGAAPPGSNSVAAVCGTCHQANAELFDKSPHRKVFEHDKLPGCVTCHGNHRVVPPTDALVSFDKPSPCAKCHQNAPSDTSAASIRRIRGVLDSLSLGKDDAVQVLNHAEQLGMDVSEARYSLKDVNQAVVQSRVAVHAFRAAALVEAARPGLEVIAKARKAGDDAVHEYRFRRQGLVISTLIVTALVILLYLKIRQIERRQRNESS